MNRTNRTKLVQRAAALVATLFGLVTIVAGARVVFGSGPGYNVFVPLLAYNTAMGFAYVAAGVFAWRDPRQGRNAAAAIFALNLLVLGASGYLYLHATGGSVAVESVQAMTLRTAVWLVLFLALAWAAVKSALLDRQAG